MSSPSRPPGIPEIAVSAAWHGQYLAGPLRTLGGDLVEVIHRGTWSHGFGPDFTDALLLFNGRELRAGSVEVHLKTSAWEAHGHHLDPRYDSVILHAVLRHDRGETRRHDGALVPVLELEPVLPAPLAIDTATVDWSRFGGATCAPELAKRRPEIIRDVLWQLGDGRLSAKSARLEARLTASPPAEILYQELWDGLGFSANRAPMRLLAERVPLAALEALAAAVSASDRLDLARGILFGAAGFLPLSPSDARFGNLSPAVTRRLEGLWHAHGGAWHGHSLPPTAWTRARVRPANHPVARLAAGAAIIANAQPVGGFLAALLAPLRSGSDPVASLRALATSAEGPGLGEDRAGGLITNAVLPFALALAEQTGDAELLEGAARAWERLPAAEPNDVTRRAQRQVAGSTRLGKLGSRGLQGLIHLDSTLCAPRRCYECPIARAVLAADALTAERTAE
jgi:hypothetical protein